MKQKPKQAAGILAVCLILFAMWNLNGCVGKSGNRSLLWYAPHSFPFEMTLTTPAVTFTMTGERTPAAVSLTVTAPAHLAGLAVAYADGNCVLSAEEVAIPLSEEAAEGLTVLLDGLLLSSAEGAKLGSAEDGRTTIAYDDIILTLDENGLPAAICHTETGREAAIFVRNDAVADGNNPETTP